MGELKPCPFCGMDVACISDTVEMGSADGTAFMYTVVCNAHDGGCGSAVGYEVKSHDAIDNWNRRHPQPVTPAGGEVVAYRYVADEGVYNPFVRDWLDGSPDQLDLENIARHPGVRFEFAYSNPPVADHELQQKWFRRGWDMYVELHGETRPPVADAALLKIADELDEQPVFPSPLARARWYVSLSERIRAALNQRGGGRG